MNPLRILRITLAVTETGSPYNQFSLPVSGQQDISICTFFHPRIAVPKEIRLFAGNDTFLGFFRALKSAIYEQEYDIVHAHTPHVGFMFSIISLLLAPRLLSSTVYTIHSSYPHYKLYHRILFLPVFLVFRRIVSCSKASYNSFPQWIRKLVGKRWFVIPNGVDLKRIDCVLRETPSPQTREYFTVLTVGRLIPLKNLETLLQAFHQSDLSNARLVFVGKGPLLSKLLEMARGLGIEERVIFTGLLSREEVYRWLEKADVFISTSTIEGLPVAVLEAMACRCPVILSDIPPHREIARGKNFVPLFPPHDMEGFSNAIRQYRQMPFGMRRDIGQNCRKLVEEHFSLKEMHESYTKIYNEVA